MESDGGWTRLDAANVNNYGGECDSVSVGSNGVLSLDPTNTCAVGSCEHGGCGMTFKKIPSSKMRVSGVSFAAIQNCGGVPFSNFGVQVVSDPVGPKGYFNGYHYPGWSYESAGSSTTTVWSLYQTQGLTNGTYNYWAHLHKSTKSDTEALS